MIALYNKLRQALLRRYWQYQLSRLSVPTECALFLQKHGWQLTQHTQTGESALQIWQRGHVTMTVHYAPLEETNP